MKYEKLESLYDKLSKHYADRNKLYEDVDKHVHSDWDLPDEIKDVSWIRTVRTTDPADAVGTTVRTFSTHTPKFRLAPLGNDEPNKKRANEIEQILRWHWKKASARAEVRPLWDIMESATRYALTACQVAYLPCQFKTYETLGINSKRAKAALALGPFVITTHNPAGIYPLYSSMMLEGVLAVRSEPVSDFVSFWGDRAKELKKNLDKTTQQYVTVWDYTDWDERVIFAFLKSDTATDNSGQQFEIINESHKLPFLPWVVKRWGNTLDSSSKYRSNPMLGSIIEAGQWDTQNIIESLGTSLIIQRAASPVAYDETPSGEGLDVDYTAPATTIHGTTNQTKFTPLPPAQVDNAIAEYADRMGNRMSKATVAKVLQYLEFPSGTAYSSISQILDTALGAVAPYKLLAQDTVAEIAKKFLEWASYYNDTLTGEGTTRATTGQAYSISPDEYDPEQFDIEVTLTPYIPIDQVALINAGTLANKNLKMPLGRILEDIGIEDSDAAIEEWEQERQDETVVALGITQRQGEQQLMIQQKGAEMQAQMQMQMQQQQMQQAMAQQQAQAKAAGNANPGGGMENASGMGFNPAAGGTPPVQAEVGVGRKRGRPEAGTGLR